jgi:hypothetical protein
MIGKQYVSDVTEKQHSGWWLRTSHGAHIFIARHCRTEQRLRTTRQMLTYISLRRGRESWKRQNKARWFQGTRARPSQDENPQANLYHKVIADPREEASPAIRVDVLCTQGTQSSADHISIGQMIRLSQAEPSPTQFQVFSTEHLSSIPPTGTDGDPAGEDKWVRKIGAWRCVPG